MQLIIIFIFNGLETTSGNYINNRMVKIAAHFFSKIKIIILL